MYEKLLADGSEDFSRPVRRRTRPPNDQIHERNDVAAEGRDGHAPQHLHERRGHTHPPADDIPDRYLWTLRMFHENGWTFTWTVTRPCTSACRSSMPRPARSFQGRTWVHVRPRAAGDRDREDSEVRAARWAGCDLGAVGFRPGRSMRTSRALRSKRSGSFCGWGASRQGSRDGKG